MNIPTTTHDTEIWPALPSPRASAILAMLYQMEQSQFWPPEKVLEQQYRQINVLVRHAHRSVPFYRDRAGASRLQSGAAMNRDMMEGIPLLTRKAIQEAGERLISEAIPQTHGQVFNISTSGSTGRPIKVKGTGITAFYWSCFTLREHLWHRRDFKGKLASIRKSNDKNTNPPDGACFNGWGPATNTIYESGPSTVLNITSSVEEQAQWLKKEDPDYLLAYPSILLELARHFIKIGITLKNLKQVCSFGELISDDLREFCREAWDVPLIDMYSSQEAGYLALQCPDHDHYHVQSENVLMEILDEQNRPCAPWEIGKVVITALHNFATPLIRYETGDYAEVGEPCPCGRGLTALNKIMGRQRNLLTFPTGEKRWPTMGADMYSKIAPVEQFQITQKSLNDIEARFVVARPLNDGEEQGIKKILLSKLGYPFNVDFIYCDAIPRSSGGKFEDFISMVD